MLLRSRFSRLLTAFGLVSLATVALGIVICTLSGAPMTLALRNLAVWAVGAALAAAIAFRGRRPLLPVFLWLLPAMLLAGFISPGLQGVHRWLAIGPIQANIAMLLGPAALVAFTARVDAYPLTSWLALVAALALAVAQPDASQATTLAAVALLATGPTTAPLLTRLLLGAVAAGGAGLAWLRPDPLAPVAEVEGVIDLAFSQSALLGLLGLALLLLTAATPLVGVPSSRHRLPAMGLGICLLAWSVAPFLGAFPVPFLGIGPSPIVGAWLGVGLLAALLRSQAAEVTAE